MHSVLKEEGHPVATLQTLLAMIEGSIGTGQYLQLFINKKQGKRRLGVKVDVIENGRFPCAFYFSSLLTLMNLLEGRVHTNVTETMEDLRLSGWYEIDEPTPGAVIIWKPKMASDGKLHRHIGFSIGGKRAVSTDSTTGKPTEHHVTYGETDGVPTRPIEVIFFHKLLCS